jgi:hypothetical protein
MLKVEYFWWIKFAGNTPSNLIFLRQLSGVARTAFIVSGIVVVCHIHNRPRLDGKTAVFEEGGMLFPPGYLHITAHINRPVPVIVAQRSLDDLING